MTIGAALLIAALTLLPPPDPGGRSIANVGAPEPSSTAAQGPEETPTSRPPTRPVAGSTAAIRPGVPVGLRIPALGVAARVVPVTAPGRVLVPPSDPAQLGWWSEGAQPGARRGSALFAGHTVQEGQAPLNELETLRPGDEVIVRTRGARITYRVERVRVFTKGRVAGQAERLFSQSAPGRLVLLTCEDWNGTTYLSNVVVTASPA